MLEGYALYQRRNRNEDWDYLMTVSSFLDAVDHYHRIVSCRHNYALAEPIWTGDTPKSKLPATIAGDFYNWRVSREEQQP